VVLLPLWKTFPIGETWPVFPCASLIPLVAFMPKKSKVAILTVPMLGYESFEGQLMLVE
jgi:hypothetical protein